jgi:hypothetical protein
MNEENLYSRGKLSAEDLHLFIKGELGDDRMREIEFILKTVFAVAVTKLAFAVVSANVSVFPKIELTFTIFGLAIF